MAYQALQSPRARPQRFLLEFDRISRTDKNYDKFRRYDAHLARWWRHTELGGGAEPPFVLFICQDDAQRNDFLARADRELPATAGTHHAPSTSTNTSAADASSSAPSATPTTATRSPAAAIPAGTTRQDMAARVRCAA